MKKLLLFFIAVTCLSCNDGDFEVPSFDFNEQVNVCGSYVLYRTNDDKTEVIALTMSEMDFTSVIGEATFPVSSSRKVIYRVLDEGISSSYFCQDIPPTSPVVLKELNAEEGTISIVTSEGETSEFSYAISISDLVFIDGKERISFEEFSFGSLNSAN